MKAFPEAAQMQEQLKDLEVPIESFPLIIRMINLLEVVKRIDFYTTAQPPIEHPELPL